MTNDIDNLREAYSQGDLSLVLGAGFSKDNGFPDWDTLISNIYTETATITKSSTTLKDVSDVFGSSANLILGRFFATIHGTSFPDVLRKCLYPPSLSNSLQLDAVKALCKFPRKSNGLDSVITFNFDDLLESNLDSSDFTTIHDEGMLPPSDTLPIYHVHGFVPRTKDASVKSNIVFSEDSYHRQTDDPYSWSNFVQLTKYINKRCLFVGLSFQDPNLRRLLNIATGRRKGGNFPALPHYAILKRTHPGLGRNTVDNLKEFDLALFGINVIWVNDYPDIGPKISEILTRS